MSDKDPFLKREAALYFSAQQFLTRLPSPAWIGWADDRLAKSAKWFPAVGLVLGVLAGFVWFGAAQVLPGSIAAGLALGALVLLTGGLHEDGFADCCDGLGGGATKERALEIMRDSRIGAYGALGIVMSLGLRWAALSVMAPSAGLMALIIALVSGRAAMTMMLWAGVYARSDGAAMSASGGVAGREAVLAIFFALVIGVVCGGMAGGLSALIALILAQNWLLRLNARLGGYTGDGLGAAEQIGQTAVLIILAGFWA